LYPELFKIGNFQISSFGLMVAIAFLVGYWVSSLEFKRKGLTENLLSNVFLALIVGGIGGAKILYLIENVPISQLVSNPLGYLFSRGGLTFYGGFIGAVILLLIVAHRNKTSFWTIGDALSPSLALGYAIGRIGCFLVGDDYGIPSNLPWAISFPKGLPPTTERVHPTQLYEVIAMMVVFLIIWKIREKPARAGWLFSIYFILAGFERFFIEFIRSTTPSPIPHLSVAQVMAIILIAVGAIRLIQINSLKPQTEPKLASAKKKR
jgi:phosphatidylglycerol---prolipoprotein diacylglyceryl transferase